MTTHNDTTSAVNQLLHNAGVTYSALFMPHAMSRKAGDRPSFNWRVSFVSTRGVLALDFTQGVGHVPEYRKRSAHELAQIAQTGLYRTASGTRPLPKPAAADVLYCAVMDAANADAPFEAWCSDCGYDPDSRKALATYEVCQKTAKYLRAVFTQEQLNALQALLADY